MIINRRNFCRNASVFGIGLSLMPFTAKTEVKKNKVVCLCKGSGKRLKINGQVRNENLEPIGNAQIEIWHNNSLENDAKFEYKGLLSTDADGKYSFETDFPQKHIVNKQEQIRRIFFKIKKYDNTLIETNLFFGENGKAFICDQHYGKTPKDFQDELPKTQQMGQDKSQVQFNIYTKF